MVVNLARRILVVDDDPEMRQMLKSALESEGYDVSVFYDAPGLLRYVESEGLPHLALIDLDLPSMHGFELSGKLKTMGDVPIVFITADDRTQIVVDGLTYYAEDYVTKPFNIPEVVARVRRILSRITDFHYTQSPAVKIDSRLSINFAQGILQVDEREVVLTPTEANLLHILIRRVGHAVSSETLISRVWPNEDVYEDTLRVHIHRLRRKIEPDYRQPSYILTERGVGYRFAIPGR